MRPIDSFILKIHGRCDLACDHCYVYEHEDQSWRRKPNTMSTATARQAAGRIAEHAARHGLDAVEVILHGGEPLLVGQAAMAELLDVVRAAITPVTALRLTMQTNGVRLTPELAALLVAHGVAVGVSLDGDRAANDRHRRFARGESSFDEAVAALSLLREPRFRPAYAGILCTVDIRNDPVAVYETIRAQRPPRVDFLLPHATWDHPPLRQPGTAGYGAWLSTIYRQWRRDGRPFAVKMFDSILSTGRGGPSVTENLGLEPVALAVIDTDGSWEQADSLKTAYDGAPATGLSVWSDPADAVAGHPLVTRRQQGVAGLCATCRSCPVVRQCGGGLLAHRYRTGSGFDNPSVYCDDLKTLIAAVDTGTAGTPLVTAVAGPASAAVVDELVRQQHAVSAAIVQRTVRRHGGDSPGWRLLGEADEADPGAAASAVTHPFVRTWLASGDPDDYLRAVAVTAAVRAGIKAEIALRTDDAGRVFLPGLGTATAGTVGHAAVTVADGGFTVGGATVAAGDLDRRAPGWRPARRVELDGVPIVIEDGDPYRDCHEWPVTGALTDAEAETWAATLRTAWRRIVADVPAYAAELRRGLRTITPLRPAADGLRSATALGAFGNVGIALTADPAALAVLLVHEFQHTKLDALLDLNELIRRDADEVRIAVAWRDDPRPAEGVLHGIYAHAAVAEVWQARTGRDPAAGERAARYARQVRDAIDAMAAVPVLTPPGERFLAAMRARADAWPR